LTRKAVSFTEINVSGDPVGRRKMIERSGGYTVPQIFIDGTAIGGSDELHMLDREGKLDPLLAREGDTQIAAAPETPA
jgi:glutaredoxin 3